VEDRFPEIRCVGVMLRGTRCCWFSVNADDDDGGGVGVAVVDALPRLEGFAIARCEWPAQLVALEVGRKPVVAVEMEAVVQKDAVDKNWVAIDNAIN
jgi:hypothetical protein